MSDKLTELMRLAYNKGWEASGEGYNWEHPGKNFNNAAWSQRREEAIRELMVSEARVVTDSYEVDHGTHVEFRPIYNEPRAEATDDWIPVSVQRPLDAGIARNEDVLAWNAEGFPTFVDAGWVTDNPLEYTHWKRTPIPPIGAPLDAEEEPWPDGVSPSVDAARAGEDRD